MGKFEQRQPPRSDFRPPLSSCFGRFLARQSRKRDKPTFNSKAGAKIDTKKRPIKVSRFSCNAERKLLLDDANRENQIAGADIIDNIQALNHFTKAGVHTVEVLRILAIVADEELRAARILASVGHRKHTAIVVLARGRSFTFNRIARAACTVADGASALNYKVGNDTMECQTVIEAAFGQLHKVGDSARSLLLVELGLHIALLGRDNCVFHSLICLVFKGFNHLLQRTILLAINKPPGHRPQEEQANDKQYNFGLHRRLKCQGKPVIIRTPRNAFVVIVGLNGSIKFQRTARVEDLLLPIVFKHHLALAEAQDAHIAKADKAKKPTLGQLEIATLALRPLVAANILGGAGVLVGKS